jgi:hypothetical protein
MPFARVAGAGPVLFVLGMEVLVMPPHASHTRPARLLVRAFCPSRLAADALAQSYERLLPVARRLLSLSAATAPTAVPRPPRAATG